MEMRAIKKPHRQNPGSDKKHDYMEALFHGNTISHENKKSRKTNENRHFTRVKSMRRQRTL